MLGREPLETLLVHAALLLGLAPRSGLLPNDGQSHLQVLQIREQYNELEGTFEGCALAWGMFFVEKRNTFCMKPTQPRRLRNEFQPYLQSVFYLSESS